MVSGIKKNLYSDIRPSLTRVCSMSAEGQETKRETFQDKLLLTVGDATAIFIIRFLVKLNREDF